jgi:hypothetical protein
MTDSSRRLSEAAGDIDAQVVRAVVDSFYPRAVALGDSARNRAQAAYALLSALIGSTLGVVVVISDQVDGLLPVATALLAAALWFIAAVTYLSAIAGPVDLETVESAGRTAKGQPSPEAQFVRNVLDQAKAETRTIRGRQLRANIFAVAALVLTFVSFIFFLIQPETMKQGVVYFNTEAEGIISQVCSATDSLSGEIVVSSLANEHLVIRVPPPTCGPAPHDMYISTTQVRMILIAEG